MHNTSLNIDNIIIKDYFDTDDIKQLITSCNYEPLYDKPHSPDLIQLAAYDTTSPDNGLVGFISCIISEFLYERGDDEGSDCVNDIENFDKVMSDNKESLDIFMNDDRTNSLDKIANNSDYNNIENIINNNKYPNNYVSNCTVTNNCNYSSEYSNENNINTDIENNTIGIAETRIQYEIEITAIVKPEYRQQGIFTKLFAALRQLIDNECVINNIDIPAITYIAANSRKQDDNTQSPDMTYAYSDYLMSITPDKICPIHRNAAINETSDKVPVKTSDKFSSKVVNKTSDIAFNNISASYEVDSDEEVFELIDTDNDTLISSVSYYPSGNSICLYDVWTNPDYRRMGCARYLLSYMINELSSGDLSIRSFILHVSGRNMAAVNLYNSMGFAVEQEIKYYRLV